MRKLQQTLGWQQPWHGCTPTTSVNSIAMEELGRVLCPGLPGCILIREKPSVIYQSRHR